MADLSGPMAEMVAADLESMLRMNLFAALFVIQEALPMMVARGEGSIVNVASHWLSTALRAERG